ncbi:unnamed protein product [Phytophthora fragariaefolia]|uniref:Unnamed protein product n=1 Tax=Phytophthora fragariaefolia TaxID=1490495 RepID=A0A9W6YBK9_9STRA|nr:unnamed protein product [Phytophthora fragariaefolia]
MSLGSLLLDWGVDKDTIVEICYLESLGQEATMRSNSSSGLLKATKKPALVSPRNQKSLVHPRSSSNNARSRKTHRNNNDEDEDSVINNNDGSESENGDSDSDGDDGEVADSTADSHVKTVRSLTTASTLTRDRVFDKGVA